MLLVAALVASGTARGKPRVPIEHEPVPPDVTNDLAFGLRLDGDLPAAIATRSGVASAPDPRRELPPAEPPGPTTSPALAGQNVDPQVASHFVPDTDTRRPSTLRYSDPFTPSTAPWKRFVAYDTINPDFSLGVREPTLVAVPLHDKAATDGSDELFFGDLVVELQSNEPTRIPSVGPGTRVLHARLGVGAEDLGFEIVSDSADNWFVLSQKGGRARLVLELAIPRAVFGGAFRDVPVDLKFQRFGSELPRDVERDARVVAAHIGVPKATPRETIEALVEYFRGFTESSAILPSDRSVYLALALSKQGVCRHRAYAFMVTATSLGIHSRVVMNEAHAWVEVWDGLLWRRVDLGGAGTILDGSAKKDGPTYAPPPDPFSWPAGSKRGEDLGRTTPTDPTGSAGGTSAGSGAGAYGAGGSGAGSSGPSSMASPVAPLSNGAPDSRPAGSMTFETTEVSATRGESLHVHGAFSAAGQPCPDALVTVSARDLATGVVTPLGEVATSQGGTFAGPIVIPRTVGVGAYELVASTGGTPRCGPAGSR